MLIEHPHAVVGQALRDMRLARRREARAIAVFRYWSAAGVSVSTRKLSEVMVLPERSARRIVSRLVARNVIERAGAGYLIVREAA